MLNVLQRLTKLSRQSIIKFDTKRLLDNLFLVAHQLLSLTSGLRLIDNGLGLPLYGAEERVVDYAFLALDQNATLPGHVLQQYVDTMITLSFHFIIRSSATSDTLLLLASSFFNFFISPRILGSNVKERYSQKYFTNHCPK